ncbi:MAG: hypothetical protein IJ282_02960 [Lachnospiraceae bacterium]|nr:hypothetical protein [Lachnospiraceae bacterium]
MKFYDITQEPIKIYGLSVVDGKERKFWRLPGEMMEKMPGLDYLGKRCTGGRVRFCTDAAEFVIRMTLKEAAEDINFPTAGSAGADVYFGRGTESVYGGYIAPWNHSQEEITIEKTFFKPAGMENVTINLPRSDHLLGMEIGLPEDAVLAPPEEYTLQAPIIYYGSSITEGGCVSRVGCAYTSILSRWLDADYRNYGFSGCAKGEEEFARFLAEHKEISAFVYDYDHNTPSIDHLQATHEKFFEIFRKAHPGVPVLMLSRPDVDPYTDDIQQLRDIVCRTYQNARAKGDKNVYFIDGRQYFGDLGRAECTIDGVHPTALGMMRMAETIYPVLRKMCYPAKSAEISPFC